MVSSAEALCRRSRGCCEFCRPAGIAGHDRSRLSHVQLCATHRGHLRELPNGGAELSGRARYPSEERRGHRNHRRAAPRHGALSLTLRRTARKGNCDDDGEEEDGGGSWASFVTTTELYPLIPQNPR